MKQQMVYTLKTSILLSGVNHVFTNNKTEGLSNLWHDEKLISSEHQKILELRKLSIMTDKLARILAIQSIGLS